MQKKHKNNTVPNYKKPATKVISSQRLSNPEIILQNKRAEAREVIFVASQDQNQDALPPVEIRLTHVTWQYGTKYGHKTGFYTISIGYSDLKDNVTGSWMDLEQISKDNEN